MPEYLKVAVSVLKGRQCSCGKGLQGAEIRKLEIDFITGRIHIYVGCEDCGQVYRADIEG